MRKSRLLGRPGSRSPGVSPSSSLRIRSSRVNTGAPTGPTHGSASTGRMRYTVAANQIPGDKLTACDKRQSHSSDNTPSTVSELIIHRPSTRPASLQQRATLGRRNWRTKSEQRGLRSATTPQRAPSVSTRFQGNETTVRGTPLPDAGR